jgi:hypothetical protein
MLEMKRRFDSFYRKAPPCAVVNLDRWLSPRVTSPTCSASHARRLSPSSRSSVPGLSWPLPRVKRSAASPPVGSAIPPPSGASVAAMRRRASRGCWVTPTARDAPSGFPPLQRTQIIQLACLEPVARGLHITHWSSADLARQAVADDIVEAISPRSVRRILHAVDLQPHRTRFWKTARLNAEFMRRAVKILWCYTYANHLAGQGYWVVCADELPNFKSSNVCRYAVRSPARSSSASSSTSGTGL